MKRRAAVLFATLVFTWLFFAEYLSPFRRVHIPFDLEGYHYPLIDYAFQSLRQWRFPQWDWSSYAGMTFVGNMQAALFYPPAWLMFLASLGKDHVSYQTLQTFVLAHVWLGSVLCFCWLRARGLGSFACIAGAQVFAFSGYVCLQLQHQGLVTAFAWFPLGAWGIDEALRKQSWLPLWKLILASGLCFLTGYPPMWVVFAVTMVAYATGRLQVRYVAAAVAALLCSLCLAMVQILPAWDAARLMETTENYGSGIQDPSFFVSYFLPNYFNFGLSVPVMTNFGMEYLYLGAPGLIGLVLLIRFRQFRTALPALLVLLATVILLTNPFDLVWGLIRHSALLSSLVRSWYFLAGPAFTVALLSAVGIDALLKRSQAQRISEASRLGATAVLLVWSAWELWRWSHQGFPSGWNSAWITIVTLTLFAAALYCLRGAPTRGKPILLVALILFSGIDYKVFGTSKRFNASVQPAPSFHSDRFPNMDPSAYQEMRANTQYRVLLDQTAPIPAIASHWGVRTPQGFDPLLTRQYRLLLRDSAQFHSDRTFDIDPANETALRLLGVRYFITGDSGRYYDFVSKSPKFRLIGSVKPYYKTFEFLGAVPSFEAKSADLKVLTWKPEHRVFRVSSPDGTQVHLSEQILPGWTVIIDGAAANLERWQGAFQSAVVPAGDHIVEFRFFSPGLLPGACISLVAVAGLIWMARKDRRAKQNSIA
jgi:hypothetical protein